MRDKNGAVAFVVAAALPVLIGGLALAIDVASYRIVHGQMQAAADAGALAGLMQLDTGGNIAAKAKDIVTRNVPANYGEITRTSDITTGFYSKGGGFVPSNGTDVNAVRVVAMRDTGRGNGIGRLFSLVWGSSEINASVVAIAARPENSFYTPPEGVILDNEAGDFNEMYAYCFDQLGGGTPASRRTQMTRIANNVPTNQSIASISGGREVNPIVPMQWPNCNDKGQTLSFRLRNVRHVKSNPQLWNNTNAEISGRRPGRPVSDYYTDTTVADGVETFHIAASEKVLETVRCDTAQCRPAKTGKNRTPVLATEPCQPGKFMYFGWEDRPPGRSGAKADWLDPAWTDTDYDDIAIRMKCPASGKLGDPSVRLVG
ncbi:hypothetical protein GCM10011529_12210 [Polymorphobacter glacialis]|uniref:Putative Flp pilus-assembly TadG-like N-terminal domain-containing protein n=2 Tax=Sandarakinorhabdus glacialis TaxID=1614636 RepID=A0A916ZP74_9SPHN|nr:hypothetical protein GCM10011529_12210 [Polymorphobacter glacialis]